MIKQIIIFENTPEYNARTMASGFFAPIDRENRKNETPVAANKIRLPIIITSTFIFHRTNRALLVINNAVVIINNNNNGLNDRETELFDIFYIMDRKDNREIRNEELRIKNEKVPPGAGLYKFEVMILLAQFGYSALLGILTKHTFSGNKEVIE